MTRFLRFLIAFPCAFCFACSPKPSGPIIPVTKAFTKSDSACQSAYSKFFKKPQVDFKIIFGYKDARPARFVGDRYEEAYFVQKLLQYGFERSKQGGDVFLKTFAGPDGAPHEIWLTVASSSAGPDDDQNRKDRFQQWKSEYAQKSFLDGLATADLVFYYGHSRDGGGPSFFPPRLNSRLHTDYSWYVKNRPGLNAMIGAMHKGRRVIGLYSCVSDRLFAKEIHRANPQAALFTSTQLLYFNDALDAMMQSLTDFIEMKCQPDFDPVRTQIRYLFQS